MTSGRRTRVEHGLHIVRKLRAGKPALWYVYAGRGGEQVHTCEGERPTITKVILDAAAEARKARFAAPENSLAGLIQIYRDSPEFAKLQPRTRKDYEIELDRIVAKWGTVPLPVFNDMKMRADIIEWRNDVADKPRTADKRVVMLATVLAHGIHLGRLSQNIATKIGSLYSANRSEIIWTDADWTALAPHCSVGLLQALKLASLTGLRLGDLVALKWAEIGTSAIVRVTNKKHRRAVVPIMPELRGLLDEIGPGTGTVLKNSRGKPWTESGLESVFHKAKIKAGVVVRIHDLRGTYATWLARMNFTDEEIARVMGWKVEQVAALRIRYVDEQHVVASMVARMAK